MFYTFFYVIVYFSVFRHVSVALPGLQGADEEQFLCFCELHVIEIIGRRVNPTAAKEKSHLSVGCWATALYYVNENEKLGLILSKCFIKT